jgi:hypothetical protein
MLFLGVAAWWVASQPFASHGSATVTDAGAPRGAAEH